MALFVLAEGYVRIPDSLDRPLHAEPARVLALEGLECDGEDCIPLSDAKYEELLPVEWNVEGSKHMLSGLQRVLGRRVGVPSPYDQSVCVCGTPRS